jgi:hypothetical protein
MTAREQVLKLMSANRGLEEDLVAIGVEKHVIALAFHYVTGALLTRAALCMVAAFGMFR